MLGFLLGFWFAEVAFFGVLFGQLFACFLFVFHLFGDKLKFIVFLLFLWLLLLGLGFCWVGFGFYITCWLNFRLLLIIKFQFYIVDRFRVPFIHIVS